MTGEPELTRRLKATSLFSGLGDADIAQLSRAMRTVEFRHGEMIFSREDEGRHLYLVLDGRVRLSVLNADARELTFRFAEAGDVLGEIAALDGGPRTADAIAMGKVRAAVLNDATLTQMLDTKPGIARAAIRALCARLRDTSDQLEVIALYPIEGRVARFLLSALRLSGADLGARSVPLALDNSQSEIALLLGASRPKVNVALGALEKSGAISRKGEGIICHPAELAAMAGMDEV